jgi:hypothetical protein
MTHDQQCAICLFVTREGGPRLADTTINGQAVCLDHINYVQGGAHAVALNLARAHQMGRGRDDDADD